MCFLTQTLLTLQYDIILILQQTVGCHMLMTILTPVNVTFGVRQIISARRGPEIK